MGYRSDVALVIKSSLVPSIPNPYFEGDSEGLLDIAKKDSRGEWTCYSWSSIKWSGFCFPGIKELNDFLNTQSEEDYYLAILGEELGDYTWDGDAINNDCPFWVGPNQTLVIE